MNTNPKPLDVPISMTFDLQKYTVAQTNQMMSLYAAVLLEKEFGKLVALTSSNDGYWMHSNGESFKFEEEMAKDVLSEVPVILIYQKV